MTAFTYLTNGFNRSKVIRWISQENLEAHLSRREREVLAGAEADKNEFQRERIEGMWALYWALGMVDRLDFRVKCSAKFYSMLPQLDLAETSDKLRSVISLRSTGEIGESADLAYCLNWVIVEDSLQRRFGSGNGFNPLLVTGRRRALDWILQEQGDEDYDDISLDT